MMGRGIKTRDWRFPIPLPNIPLPMLSFFDSPDYFPPDYA